MAKNSIFTPLAAALVVLGLFSSGANAQCKTTFKQRLLGAVIVAGAGAAIGNAASYRDHAQGALIGAAAGAPLGAAMTKNTHCKEARKMAQGVRPAPIAPASAPEPEVMSGPPVIIHNVSGANQQALVPVINQGLAKQGYSLIDTQFYRSPQPRYRTTRRCSAWNEILRSECSGDQMARA